MYILLYIFFYFGPVDSCGITGLVAISVNSTLNCLFIYSLIRYAVFSFLVLFLGRGFCMARDISLCKFPHVLDIMFQDA